MLDFISSKQVVLSVSLLALCFTLGYAQQGTPAQFSTAVEQIVLYASVYDKDSILVENLEKEDFTIFEDRIQQEVTYFGRDDVPSTLGVVIDSSGSMRDKFDLVNDATRLFLSKNNPENEMFFVAFKDEVRLEQDFTQDVEDIYDALDNVIISGGTALYDAIYLAVDKVLKGNEPKKAVIVFTDGEDKDSFYSHKELIEKVEESDVQLYIVAFLDSDLSSGGGFFGVFKSAREKIQQKIREIPQSTGGEAFFPEEISQLERIGHLWTVGDKYYKLAYEHYGDSRYWWVIAWFNRMPTEGQVKLGDIVVIPLPLSKILDYLDL